MLRVYHESLGEELVVAQEKLIGGELHVSSAEYSQIQVRWKISQLQVHRGGAGGRLWLVTNPLQPGWTLYIRDSELIENIRKANPNLKVPRKPLIDSGGSIILMGITAVIVLFGGLWLAKDPLVSLAVSAIPKEAEIKIGELAAKQFVSLGPRFEKGVEELNVLLGPIHAIAKREGYDLKVFIVDKTSLNAFALPGGYMVFHKGMLTAAETPEEILGVASHELAHITQRHSLKQMVSNLGTFVLLQVFLGDISGIIGVVAENSQFLLYKMYSREAERDADAMGLSYLHSANISGKGLVTFFEKLQAQIKKQEEQINEELGVEADFSKYNFLSTHPAAKERIANLKKEIVKFEGETMEGLPPVDFSLVRIKEHLK